MIWNNNAKIAYETKGSQHHRILRTLKMNSKFGTPNYVFTDNLRILKYSSRIAELRREGHNIEAVREEVNGRKTGVWRYFYVDEPVGV